MKILVIAHYCWPHIGGVERHVSAVNKILKNKYKNEMKVISEADIGYPHIKYFGLFYIWFWLWKNRRLIKEADIIQIHDVFIWYLPFRFFYPKKPVFTTFHGWEGKWPLRWQDVLMKKLAAALSAGTIAVGRYIEKYYGIRADKIIYGGVEKANSKKQIAKIKNSLVFLGRLEEDTGLPEFLKWLKGLPLRSLERRRVEFVGDGSLRKECEKYGMVHGFCGPDPFLSRAEICVPGGYLAYLEAKSLGCKIKIFLPNRLRKDYWRGIAGLKNIPTWDQIADEYLDLYNRKK